MIFHQSGYTFIAIYQFQSLNDSSTLCYAICYLKHNISFLISWWGSYHAYHIIPSVTSASTKVLLLSDSPWITVRFLDINLSDISSHKTFQVVKLTKVTECNINSHHYIHCFNYCSYDTIERMTNNLIFCKYQESIYEGNRGNDN